MLRGFSGPLRAETDGGTLLAQDLAAATATITTGGGSAMVSFVTAPEKVSVAPKAARPSWPCPAARTT